MENITVKIVAVVFSNKNNGFHVLKVKREDGTLIRVCGAFPGISISTGLKASFAGRHETHPSYGPQFTASTCEIIPEAGRSGIITYITSNVNSIGLITASKLYDYFGDDLVSILDKDPERIRSLPFLTKKQADAIVEEWSSVSESRNSSIYLSNLGLSGNQIKSVYTKFGSRTRELIAKDPYIISQCSGVGFVTADQAARRLSIGVDDSRRVKAVIYHAVSELCNSDGHMYVHSSQMLEYINRRLFKKNGIESFSHGDFITESQFYPALKTLVDSNELVCQDDKYYLSQNWEYENNIAKHIAKSLALEPHKFNDLDVFLDSYEESNKIKFSDDQRSAFGLLNQSRVIAISGYPGTGKTTLISAFVKLFEKYNFDFSLMSPTGIAAKRLSQVTGRLGTTIHRALGYKKDGTWEFHSGNKFTADAIIIDEMSMVDSATFYNLLSAIKSSTILVMVGDSAQLPSVGAGYVFNNLLECRDLPHVSLARIYRQGKTSDIVTVAHSILNGTLVDFSHQPESEFIFFNMPENKIVNEICSLTQKLKELGRNFQVISPMHDGELGVNNLNQELRDILNPDHGGKNSYIKSGETGLYEGDRVMVVKNNYDKMVFNGDVGKIVRINIKNDEVDVKVFGWFDQESSTPRYIDKVITFTVEESRTMLKVAYACTAHKVQGQEFDYVIMPMTHQYGIMLYRNLVYTAITRAKKKVFIFGNPSAFLSAASNIRETIRNSQLKDLISDHFKIETAQMVMTE